MQPYLPSQVIKGGLKPLRRDPRDYDFLKTKKLAGAVPSFPDNYCTDVGLWMPDQNADGQPFGCTNYDSADLLIDQDRILYDPAEIEKVSRANELGGIDLRDAAKAAKELYGRNYFWVRPGGPIDWFDAVCLAVLVGKSENRAVAVGTAWFPEWNRGAVRSSGILSAPADITWRGVGHAWAAKGWKTINGELYLIVKSWQGKRFGDDGFAYISRPLFNRLMSNYGSAAFVFDKLLPGEQPQVIDGVIKQWLVGFFWKLFRVQL